MDVREWVPRALIGNRRQAGTPAVSRGSGAPFRGGPRFDV